MEIVPCSFFFWLVGFKGARTPNYKWNNSGKLLPTLSKVYTENFHKTNGRSQIGETWSKCTDFTPISLKWGWGHFPAVFLLRVFSWSQVQSLNLLEVKRGPKATALLGGVTAVCSRITSGVLLSFLRLPSPVCFISFCSLFPFPIRNRPLPLGSFPASSLQRPLSHPLQFVLSSYSEEKLSSILSRIFAV